MSSTQPKGAYGKFKVSRNDNRDQPGGDRHGAEYFVLDLTHDTYAVKALEAYASACYQQYPELSRDLRARIDKLTKS